MTYCNDNEEDTILSSKPSSTTQEHWFIFQNDQLLILREENANKLITPPTLTVIKDSLTRQYALGILQDGSIYFCAEISNDTPLPSHIEIVPLRKAFNLLGNEWFSAAVKAYSIITWDKNHQFCGRCGQPTSLRPSSFERACHACNLHFYPRISPSIIVRIQKDNEILMARSPHFSPGMYGLIAGFVEVGETLEEAARREVLEEVGIEIKNLNYFTSQPWPFPDSLMVAFTAEYAGGELIINHAEIEDAGWYSIDNLPGYTSSSVSVAAKLIDDFILQQRTLR